MRGQSARARVERAPLSLVRGGAGSGQQAHTRLVRRRGRRRRLRRTRQGGGQSGGRVRRGRPKYAFRPRHRGAARGAAAGMPQEGCRWIVGCGKEPAPTQRRACSPTPRQQTSRLGPRNSDRRRPRRFFLRAPGRKGAVPRISFDRSSPRSSRLGRGPLGTASLQWRGNPQHVSMHMHSLRRGRRHSLPHLLLLLSRRQNKAINQQPTPRIRAPRTSPPLSVRRTGWRPRPAAGRARRRWRCFWRRWGWGTC